MNAAQITYLAWMGLILFYRTPNHAMWVLLANMLATFAACGAMDAGWLDRGDSTMTMMLIDFASLAVALVGRDLAVTIAFGYFLTVISYSLTIFWGVQSSTTFAIVNLVGFVQLAVVSIGSGGNNGGRRLRRFAGFLHSVVSPRRNVVCASGTQEADRGTVKHG